MVEKSCDIYDINEGPFRSPLRVDSEWGGN